MMNELGQRAASLMAAGANLLLGAACPGCAAAGWGVCADCRAALAELAGHWTTRPELRGLPPIKVAGHYEHPLRGLLVSHKDDGCWYLAGPLGGLLAGAVAGLDPPDDCLLVPVPSDPRSVRARGYDHARALAARAARLTGQGWRPLLTRRHAAPDQAGQSRRARLADQHRTMVAGIGRSVVIVVDDIVTTGATAAEAVRALGIAGHHVWGVAAVCETTRHTSSDSANELGRGR